jgi:hypothetical protein
MSIDFAVTYPTIAAPFLAVEVATRWAALQLNLYGAVDIVADVVADTRTPTTLDTVEFISHCLSYSLR